MASPKIKKKSGGGKSADARRQGAIPCLVLIAIVLGIVAFVFFASLAHGSVLSLKMAVSQ
jgi:hypothetical protein